jgi:hypothetical protein
VEPTIELIDEIYRERVLRARQTPPEEKLLAGPRLFERSCSLMRAGIRSQYPDADEAQVEDILRQRLAIVRRLQDLPCPATKPLKP